MGADPQNCIPLWIFDTVVNGSFVNVAWGILSFKKTMEYLKKAGEKQNCPDSYKLQGLPYALQIWMYEICGAAVGVFCQRKVWRTKRILPRMFHWIMEEKEFRKATVLQQIFNKEKEELDMQELQCTEKEVRKFIDGDTENKDEKEIHANEVSESAGQNCEEKSNDSPFNTESEHNQIEELKKFMEDRLGEMQENMRKMKENMETQMSTMQKEIDRLKDELKKQKDAFANEPLEHVSKEAEPEYDDAKEFRGDGNNGSGTAESTPITRTENDNERHIQVNTAIIPFTPLSKETLDWGQPSFDLHLTQSFSNINSTHTVRSAGLSNSNLQNEAPSNVIERDEVCLTEQDDGAFIDKMDPSLIDSIEAASYMVMADVDDMAEADLQINEDRSSKRVSPRKKRNVRPGRVLCSPYKNKFGSDEKGGKKTVVGGRYALDDFAVIGNEISNKEKLLDFEKFFLTKIHKTKTKRGIWYPPKLDIMDACDLGIFSTTSKTFFVDLLLPDQWLSDMHIDVCMYYLRKKGHYSTRVKLNFTTTDMQFFHGVQAKWHQYGRQITEQKNSLTERDAVGLRMRGRGMPFARPWVEVDHVLIPMIAGGNHWILGRFEVATRTLFIYDSKIKRLRAVGTDSIAKAFSKILPVYFEYFEIFNENAKLMESEAYKGKSSEDITIVHVTDIPQQIDCDCGIFCCTFAEYLIEGRAFPKNIDVKLHRARLAMSLY